MARIRNISAAEVILGPGHPENIKDPWLADGIEVVLLPNAGADAAKDHVMFNADLAKSATLAAAVTAGTVSIVNYTDEPLSGTPVANAGVQNAAGLATPVSVANGGTGAATHTAHGVLLGEGSSAIAASAAGTAGQAFLSGGAGADGAYGVLDVSGAAVSGFSTALNAHVKEFDSAASAGGAAFEVLTVTGLLATDTILSVSQRVAGASATAATGWNTQANNALTVTWTANPGAGAIVRVAVLR